MTKHPDLQSWTDVHADLVEGYVDFMGSQTYASSSVAVK